LRGLAFGGWERISSPSVAPAIAFPVGRRCNPRVFATRLRKVAQAPRRVKSGWSFPAQAQSNSFFQRTKNIFQNMKKKILIGLAAVAVAAVAAVNVNYVSQDSNLSALALANVEILAYSELSDNGIVLRWSSLIDCGSKGKGSYKVCQERGSGNGCNQGGATTCTCGVNC
jgi:hypothetical protein